MRRYICLDFPQVFNLPLFSDLLFALLSFSGLSQLLKLYHALPYATIFVI